MHLGFVITNIIQESLRKEIREASNRLEVTTASRDRLQGQIQELQQLRIENQNLKEQLEKTSEVRYADEESLTKV